MGQKWRIPLTWRILAVNIFVIALLVGGFLYLDSYRSRLIEERQERLAQGEAMLYQTLVFAGPFQRPQIIRRFAAITGTRIRLYGPDGAVLDSFALDPPTYQLRDPSAQVFTRDIARAMDRAIDWAVMATAREAYTEPAVDRAQAWSELNEARARGAGAFRYRLAPDRTPMLSYARNHGPYALLVMTNARDVTRAVRAERTQLGLILAAVTIVSILLSLFLARTIVQPLQRLADAAARVRLGRARDVAVPRLPTRGDEIGTLARTLSDMTMAMHARIDAGEDFAADVTHELKNPLASLRSAIEGLGRVEQTESRTQLLGLAADDVQRLDRLITDISEASRVDAELSRARFERVDVGALIKPIIEARQERADAGQPMIAFARPRAGTAIVMGEPSRLARVIENLLDNALSFSPPCGVVRISATSAGGDVIIRVEDDGPGVPPDQRDHIFRRFHSVRPIGEDFGQHSGLGLAIARTIIEAHEGHITVHDRADAANGACFEIALPAAAMP
ncbi:MAG: stimulus-sensing domain-containing protein [Sphingopyxis sp.]